MPVDLAAIEPLELPFRRYSDRADLPETAGVYFAIVRRAIKYVGESSKIRQRWRCHELRAELGGLRFCRIAWLEIPARSDRLSAERFFKLKFNPALNNRQRPTKPLPYLAEELEGRDEYTTGQAAVLIGDISPSRVLQIAKEEMDEGVGYKRFGRFTFILPAGITQIQTRNKKPGRAVL